MFGGREGEHLQKVSDVHLIDFLAHNGTGFNVHGASNQSLVRTWIKELVCNFMW